MKLMLINGSVREGRVSDKVQAWALGVLKQDNDLDIDVADLKEVDLPFFNEATTPSMAHDQFQNPKANAWAQRVRAAEAFIFITPEYNHGPSAVMKNAIDWLYDSWHYKPVGFISYGGLAAGTRAVQQLKQNILHVKLFPINSNVHIPNVGTAFDAQGNPVFPGLNDNLAKLVAELKELKDRLGQSGS